MKLGATVELSIYMKVAAALELGREKFVFFLGWMLLRTVLANLFLEQIWLAAIAFGDFLLSGLWFVGSVGFLRIQCGIKIKDSDKRINNLGVLCIRQYLELALKPFQIRF